MEEKRKPLEQELIESIGLMIKKGMESNTDIYTGVVKSVDGKRAVVAVNGQNQNVAIATADVSSGNVVRVFVPNGNMSAAFIIKAEASGGGGGSTTTAYGDLTEKPKINDVTLVDNKTSKELKLYGTGNEPPYPVKSVDGATGAVVTNAVKTITQSLTDAQKQQARANIGAGTSNFSGSYNDLVNKPTIPDPYVLPIASNTTLGGVKADNKTEEQTTPVGIDTDGKLWVHVDGGGGTIDTILADKVMFDSDMVFTEQFGKYEPSGGKVTIPSNGKSLKELLLDAYSEDKNPTVTQPTVGISSSTAKAYEVGTVVTPQYSGSFNAGKYEYGPNPTGVTVTEWQATSNVTTETKTTQTGTFAAYRVLEGVDYRITIKATYSDGVVPVTALGAQYEAGKIVASSKTAQSGAITWYRNSFYGTMEDKSIPVTNLIIRTLQQKSGKSLSNGSSFTVDIPVGAETVLIAYPASLQNITSIKDVNAMNADITSAFTRSLINVTGNNNYAAISYKLYRIDYANPNDVANKYTVTI